MEKSSVVDATVWKSGFLDRNVGGRELWGVYPDARICLGKEAGDHQPTRERTASALPLSFDRSQTVCNLVGYTGGGEGKKKQKSHKGLICCLL